MVNFHNPVTVAREFAASINIWHTMGGIFIWEFFTTLNYEWDVIRGHRPYRWTIWVYTITRVATLMAIIFNIFRFDDTTTTKVNCQAEATMNLFFVNVAFGSASLLVVFRLIAIWNRKTIIVLIVTGLWFADVAFLIYGNSQLRGVWSDKISDVVLLPIMFVGLLRLRPEITEFGLGRVLWNQGLAWLFLATIAEIPPTVLMCLNLNDALDLMFLCPSMVIMSITATRMYRSLINFGSNEISSEVGHRMTVSQLRFRSQSIPLKQMPVQVSLGTDNDQHSMSQSNVAAQTP